jgi:hypothetical protein
MCLIADVHVAQRVFGIEPDAEFEPVRSALFQKKAKAVHGGKLTDEYCKLERLRRLLTELDRQGILRMVDDSQVREMTKIVIREKLCISDDQHIVALARVSQTRLLCSFDKDLHADFSNPKILNPKGSIYQKASHAGLIAKHCKHDKKPKR